MKAISICLGIWLSVCLAIGLSACGDTAPTVTARSAWATVDSAFGHAFFDAAARGRLMTADAAARFVLPGLVDERRYRYLQVAELRRLDPTRRAGTVAFAIDGWPTAFAVELTRAGPVWTLTNVPPEAAQRDLLALTGPDGIPTASTALVWNGGLAGRDAAGRPTAAVLLLGRDDRLWVDGRRLEQVDPSGVVAALRAAIKSRHLLAKDAHATYRPQVAIALLSTASALRHATLAAQAREAGAEVLLLVVRRADGNPGYLPLALPKSVPAIGVPPVLAVRQDLAGAHLDLHGQSISVPPKGDSVDPDAVRTALRNLAQHGAAPVGAVLVADADGDHRRTIALLDALRAANPDLPVTTRIK